LLTFAKESKSNKPTSEDSQKGVSQYFLHNDANQSLERQFKKFVAQTILTFSIWGTGLVSTILVFIQSSLA
jgi:hypothetical protein